MLDTLLITTDFKMTYNTNNDSLVLIVDDNYKNIQLLGNVLRGENLDIAVATNGIQALQITKEVLPNLILLDIMIPDMDGYQVCQLLKEDPKTAEIPIIFLTAKTEAEDIIKGLTLGAVDYITKPFNNQELLIRVKTHLALQNSKEELKKTNAEKDKFFSIIAHDLKNPFITMLGFSSMLVTDYYDFSDEERITYIKEMEGVAKKSYELLENLLQWSRSQTGRIEFNPMEFDLNDVVKDTLELLGPQAKAKEILLTDLLTDNNFIFSDIEMIRTVIRNICSNAIKFTNKGGNIIISAISNNKSVKLKIKDDGIGMDNKTLNGLFNLSTHNSKKGTMNESGTGLGLILCKEFVEKNKGTIEVSSVLNEGTEFTIVLPVPSQ
ncbi:MAG TPA: hybrid sensor histidine kinase/response regulator [Melioribacteraceae bacterium]|nr:hybrid sensor histidine kinase/response regulator [Melioribacteraceae bacterium]